MEYTDEEFLRRMQAHIALGVSYPQTKTFNHPTVLRLLIDFEYLTPDMSIDEWYDIYVSALMVYLNKISREARTYRETYDRERCEHYAHQYLKQLYPEKYALLSSEKKRGTY